MLPNFQGSLDIRKLLLKKAVFLVGLTDLMKYATIES
jgi:hypothetical protein